jgi:hypothetical protein
MRTIFKYSSVATAVAGVSVGQYMVPNKNRIRAVFLSLSPSAAIAAAVLSKIWVTVNNPDLNLNVDERPNLIATLEGAWFFGTAVGVATYTVAQQFIGLDFAVNPNDKIFINAYTSTAVNCLAMAQIFLQEG